MGGFSPDRGVRRWWPGARRDERPANRRSWQTRGVRVRGVVAQALGAAVVLSLGSACSGDEDPFVTAPTASASPVSSYDGALEAAAAVLPLVPEAATTLAVTDFEEVKAQLGVASVVGTSPQAQQDELWRTADKVAPLLSRGLLRPVQARVAQHGFTQADVLWEAHFSGPATGWVMRLRDGVDPAAVTAAVEAGIGPLRGATVLPDLQLVVSGTTADGDASWADLPEVVSLVGREMSATYVQRGCLPGDTGGLRLEELAAYAVEFASTLATAQLGQGRGDLFDRLAVGEALPSFASVFTQGVADPSSGRIGYRMSDPAQAADLALRGRLPFAVCAS